MSGPRSKNGKNCFIASCCYVLSRLFVYYCKRFIFLSNYFLSLSFFFFLVVTTWANGSYILFIILDPHSNEIEKNFIKIAGHKNIAILS